MFYTKKGLPEEGENVVATISKIQYHSVFANLNQYPGKSGLLHISEIAPGRIRNINEYVKEGKVVVLKVLRVNEKNGHIDLSLRRVSESQRLKKMSELKQEQKAEKIIEDSAKALKIEPKKLYSKIAEIVFKDYDYIYDYFFEVAMKESDITYIKLAAKEEKELHACIVQRIKQPMVELRGKLKITSYLDDGISVIRQALDKADNIDDQITVRYGGAGLYTVKVISKEFKDAEAILKKALKEVEKIHDGKKTIVHFEREDARKLVQA